ncbi:HD domain-containing phosphohydrolase [Vibrio sp. TH_r3]|uniref:HD domain-containing phosphohydrolase n=1 Tax=Vibrio sp. TH_r3 TaxID=3082084 RepID=UPI0029555D26|nr:HD domain-containing phosphohydrolase [Vibrio sp. TH_r3]MDV7102966.1 HD domain-containing phosphohydrolase [Vibrio sp. TH_r3]
MDRSIERLQPVQSTSKKLDSLYHELDDIHQRIRGEVASVDRVALVLYNPKSGNLHTHAESSATTSRFSSYSYPLDACPELKKCAEHGATRVIDDIAEKRRSDRKHANWLVKNSFNSSYTVPLYKGDNFVGFVFYDSHQKAAFTNKVQQQLAYFSELICHAVNTEHSLLDAILCSAELTKELSPGYKNESKEHMERVSTYALLIAKEVADIYDLDDELIENVHLFSRVHDIGKSTLSSDILLSPDFLAGLEREQIRNYVTDGVIVVDQIIENLGCPSHRCIEILKEITACHQEFLDGSGYPNGLVGDEVPISARIVTVANVFDALTSHRPYKQACSVTSALLELEKMVWSGKLDKNCVNALRNHQQYLASIIRTFPESDPST